MFYILDKSGRIVGSADGPVDAKELAHRGEVVVASELNLPIERVNVTGDPANPILIAKQVPTVRKMILQTSAKDSDGDGLADLPADGTSRAEITATLYDAVGEVVEDQVEIQFRTSAGKLSSRQAVTKKGEAKIHLTASHDTVMATVSASAPGFESTSIEFEFLPVTEEPAKTTKK